MKSNFFCFPPPTFVLYVAYNTPLGLNLQLSCMWWKTTTVWNHIPPRAPDGYILQRLSTKRALNSFSLHWLNNLRYFLFSNGCIIINGFKICHFLITAKQSVEWPEQEVVVCPWHPSRKHIVMFVHRLFVNSLFSIVFECFSLKIVLKNSGNARKWSEKSLSSSPRSPITMRSKPLFQILCHHSGKPIYW